MKKQNKIQLFLIIIALGLLARIFVSSLGYNFDTESYWLVANIRADGGNVYAQTVRYNYGPIWFYVLEGLYKIAQLSDNPFEVFKLLITVLLSLVDIGIAGILFRKFNLTVATLFFLNPIAIFITGYHRQFDNVAILVGLLAIVLLGDQLSKSLTNKELGGLLLIGLSLMIKHVLILFPVWLAIKKGKLQWKILFVIIPVVVFLLGFIPFLSEGSDGIKHNVFQYSSSQNMPLWHMIAPEFIVDTIPTMILFVGSLLIAGLIFKRESLFDVFALYLGMLVVFSPSVVNQTLAIPMILVATRFNIFFGLYTVIASIHLLADQNGLGWMGFDAVIPNRFVGYYVQIPLLLLGIIWCYRKQDLITYAQKTCLWLRNNVVEQVMGFSY